MTEGTSESHISGVLMPSHQILRESTEASGVSHITITNTMISEVVKRGIYPLADILPHVSVAGGLDSACAMFAAAIPADIAGNLPEGAVLQIMPDATVLTVTSLKDISKSSEVSGSSVICAEEVLKDRLCSSGQEVIISNNQETEQCFSSVQNLNVETSEHITAPVIELAGSSEGNVSDLDLSFLNEPEDAVTISDSQGAHIVEPDIHHTIQNLPSNQLPSTETVDSCNSMVSGTDQNLADLERPDSAISNPQTDADSSVVVIDVSKPIQLSQNSLIVVNGQKCVLQHDSQTGQVVAYPVKEPERPKRKRGRPRKVKADEMSSSEKPATISFSCVETEDITEDEAVEKGLLEVVTDDGAVVRRSSRKRKKARILKDYETGNLKQELGSDIDETDITEKDECLPGRKKGKQRGPGRPRKYPVPSSSITGRKRRVRPRHSVSDKEATQAFLIQTASGQNLMMHVPLSSIPPGMSLQDVAQGIANSLNLAVSQNSETDSAAVEASPSSDGTELQLSENGNLADSSESPEDQTSNASLQSSISINEEVAHVSSEPNVNEIIVPCLQDHIAPDSNISFEQIDSLREMGMDSSDEFVNNTSREILSATQPVSTESSSETGFTVINDASVSIQDQINNAVICRTQDDEEMVEDNADSAHFIKLNVNESASPSGDSLITVTSANNVMTNSSTIFSISSGRGVTHFRLCDGSVKKLKKSDTDLVHDLPLDQNGASFNSRAVEENFKPSDYVPSTSVNVTVECSTVNQTEAALDSLLTSRSASDAEVTNALVNSANAALTELHCHSPKKYEHITSSFGNTSDDQSKGTVNCSVLGFESAMDICEQQSVDPMNDEVKGNTPESSAVIDDIMSSITVAASASSSDHGIMPNNVNSSDENFANHDCSLQTSIEDSAEKQNGVQLCTEDGSEVADVSEPSPNSEAVNTTSVPEKRKRGRPRKYPLNNNVDEKLDHSLSAVGFELTSLHDVTSLLNQHAGKLPEIASSVSSITGTPATVIPLPEKMLPMLLPKPENSGLSFDTTKKLGCLKCDYHADNEFLYQQHLLSHPNETKHCKCCKFSCFTEEELIQHFNDKHPRCICSVCNHMAEHAYIIKRHSYRHTENGCTCSICGGTYKDHYILKTHIKMVHTPAETLFQCHLCEKKFTRKAHLKRHLRTHDPNKAYKCQHCDYRGCEKSDITKHMLVHEEPKHKCDFCIKTFRHIKNKELHMKRHKGQRDFKCFYCDFFGYTVTDIKKHMERKHMADAQTFLCNKCGQICGSEEALKEHEGSNQCETYLLEQICEESSAKQLENNVNGNVEDTEAAAAAVAVTPSVLADSSQDVHNIATVTLEDGTVAALNTDSSCLQNGQIILGNVEKFLGTIENNEIIFRSLGNSDLLSSGYLTFLSSSGGKNSQLAIVTSDGSTAKLSDITAMNEQPNAVVDAAPEVCSKEIKDQQKVSDSHVENLIMNTSVLNDYHQEIASHTAAPSS